MPLRAIQPDGAEVLAFELDDDAWSRVRASIAADRQAWRLPCCDAQVVAKTSRLGTRFFAHNARGGCTWEPETPHHVHLKSLAVKIARACGWDASTEVQGVTPDGALWKADVLATRGSQKVAVEVQWSHQSNEELAQRQARYKASGVRGLWLIRQEGFLVTEDIPAALVREDRSGHYRCWIPTSADARLKRDAWQWAYRDIGVDTVLEAAFTKRLRWGVRRGDAVTWTAYAAATKCWKCGAPTTKVTDVRVDVLSTSFHLSLSAFTEHPDLLRDVLPHAISRQHGIGPFKKVVPKGKTVAILGNACVACRIFQRPDIDDQHERESVAIHSGTTVVDERWEKLLSRFVGRYWRLTHLQPTRDRWPYGRHDDADDD